MAKEARGSGKILINHVIQVGTLKSSLHYYVSFFTLSRKTRVCSHNSLPKTSFCAYFSHASSPLNFQLQVVKQTPCRLRVRWAALLHDVGKPATVSVDQGRKKIIFHSHENVGALMVDRILTG
jgi:putative nucleotidyltransferase with HDIG domain